MATSDPKDLAFNQYYNDLYNRKPGTQGQQIYNQLTQSYQNQALQAGALADANLQAANMQQAATVKSITDQVRAERMARLKSGMSESQIASQDIQMMMSNVNALNDQTVAANQARAEAQVGYNQAQDQAYQDYLTQANAQGQVASAMYAADSGNPYWATVQHMRQTYGNDPALWTSAQWDEATKLVTGQWSTVEAANIAAGK